MSSRESVHRARRGWSPQSEGGLGRARPRRRMVIMSIVARPALYTMFALRARRRRVRATGGGADAVQPPFRPTNPSDRRRMARPLYAQINLAALRENLPPRPRTGAGHPGPRRRQGQRVRTRIGARAARARGRRRPRAGRGGSGVRPARAPLYAPHPDARRVLRGKRAARVRAAAAGHRGARHGTGADARDRRARAAARGLRQGQHRDEPAGIPAVRRRRASATGWRRRRRSLHCAS